MNTKSKQLPKIGITIGDLNGIGPEIVLKCLMDQRFQELCIPVIYGSAQTLIYHKKLHNIKNFTFNIVESAEEAHPKKINLVNAWDYEVKIESGMPSKETGKAALDAIEKATEEILRGNLDAIVTAPINKKTVRANGFEFPGHTEYFAKASGTENYLMMLISDELKVATVTGHIPLSRVPEEVTKKAILRALKTLNASLMQDFGIEKPKIAVLGLNPHAGEEGEIGTEELEQVNSALEEAKRQDVLTFGPYPADGFFGNLMYRNFDAVLSMYHDQGLIPFKLLAFDKGVNYTAGLPFVRTSPDHGTAYSLAGKGNASETSFLEAVYAAISILRNRATDEEIHANPLEQRIERQKER